MVKAAVLNAAKKHGYTVIDNKSDLKKDTVIVKGNISKFWTWETPDNAGFVDLYTGLVETEIQIYKKDKLVSSFVAKGIKERNGWPKDKNFIRVLNEAYQLFTDDLYVQFPHKIK